MFSAERKQLSAFRSPCLLALHETYNWGWKVERGMLLKTVTLIYPDPTKTLVSLKKVLLNITEKFKQ
jgi:hypothetical protein